MGKQRRNRNVYHPYVRKDHHSTMCHGINGTEPTNRASSSSFQTVSSDSVITHGQAIPVHHVKHARNRSRHTTVSKPFIYDPFLDYFNEFIPYMQEREPLAHLDGLANQKHLTIENRSTMVRFIVKLCKDLHLPGEVLFKAVDLMDRYLSMAPTNFVMLSVLQSIAATTLVIAIKACELDYKGFLADIVKLCGGTVIVPGIKALERHILTTLQYDLNRPTALDFLYQFVLRVKVVDVESESKLRQTMELAETILSFCLQSYELSCCKRSLLAKIALLIATEKTNSTLDIGHLFSGHRARKGQMIYLKRRS